MPRAPCDARDREPRGLSNCSARSLTMRSSHPSKLRARSVAMQATEWDEDMLEQIDLDQRAEEEELPGRVMHPSCADYSCLSWCPDPTDIDHSPDAVSAKDVNWHPPLCLRKLGRADFACDAVHVRTVLERGIRDLEAPMPSRDS